MRMRITAVMVLAIAFLSACGGGSNNPVAPNLPVDPVSVVASLSITPGSTLLARQDDNHQLSVELFDADGATLDKPVVWSSSDTSIVTIDEQGLLTSMGTVGSATVTAEVDGVQSGPVLVSVVLPVVNAQFINDDQVVGDPEQVDPESSFAPGALYRVTLTGVDSPDIGTVLLAREEIPIAGGVVAVEPDGDNIIVTLEVLPINELFTSLKIDQVFVPTEDDFEISEVAAEFYTMEQQTDGSYLFTLLPGIPVAEPVSSSAPGGSFLQKATAAPGSVGQAAIGTVANPQHPFNCSFSGPSFDSAGNQVLTIAGMSPSIVLERDISLPFIYDSDNGGLQKIGLEGRVKGTFTVRNKLSVQLEGKAGCKLQLAELRVPLPGALALVLGGQIPLGIGFELSGKVTLAEMGFGVTASAEMRTEFGITCPNGMDCEFDDPQFTPTGEVKPVFDFPPGFSNPAADLKFEPAIQGFGYADFQFGNPFFSSWRVTLAELQAGVKLGANLALVETQIDDGDYSSGYKLSAEFSVKPGSDLANLLRLLGMSQMSALTITGSDNLLTSPAAEVPITAPSTKLITADVADYTVGDVVTFTVRLDPTTVNFLPFIYNVDEVMIYRDKVFIGSNDPTRVERITASDGQTEFTIEWIATESGSIGDDFHAFVSTGLLPLPYFGELELGKVTAPVATQEIILVKEYSEIYAMDRDGSNQVNLTNNSRRDYEPVVSPDKNKILFLSHRDFNYEIYVMDSDGSNQLNLSNSELDERAQSWSPDGSKILFTRDAGPFEGGLGIYTMNADGTNQVQLVAETIGEDFYKPSWSPDGTKILFIAEYEDNEGDNVHGVFVINADGTGQQLLTPTFGDEGMREVVWSPDGNRIAFTVSYSSGGSNGVAMYILNSDGSNLEQVLAITSSYPSAIAWSPDGARIMYEASGSVDNTNPIFYFDVIAGSQVSLTNNIEPGLRDYNASWSSDGGEIIFTSNRNGNEGIYIMDSDGANQTRIPNSTISDTRAIFQ